MYRAYGVLECVDFVSEPQAKRRESIKPDVPLVGPIHPSNPLPMRTLTLFAGDYFSRRTFRRQASFDRHVVMSVACRRGGLGLGL